MGHRTEQVPQQEVLIKTPPKGAGFQLAPAVCSLVDMMKRVNYLEPEKPLATKGQAQKSIGYFFLSWSRPHSLSKTNLDWIYRIQYSTAVWCRGRVVLHNAIGHFAEVGQEEHT
ncbi:hypothetical protein AVEN_51077-1 [Araneus ventricosus]|uniref:Uncharacterized protein n=1 Tax=Araneus ventricosus TaxID=182803 RepID=A0A4Y2UP00_ARAVE|nr:hypothetical protein AVEN_51077-1 [Araneus ventricosus]